MKLWFKMQEIIKQKEGLEVVEIGQTKIKPITKMTDVDVGSCRQWLVIKVFLKNQNWRLSMIRIHKMLEKLQLYLIGT